MEKWSNVLNLLENDRVAVLVVIYEFDNINNNILNNSHAVGFVHGYSDLITGQQ